MKNIFEKVQTEFMTLSNLLEDVNFEIEMKKDAYFYKINDALCNTYIALNQGFCESKMACSKCAKNRDELEELIQLADEAQYKNDLKDAFYLELRKFRTNIPSILIKMETVYIENLEKVH